MSLKKKRKDRKKETAEDFTPSWLVNEMLDKLPEAVFIENQTFLDPACGNGNMLLEVFKRKLKYNHTPIASLNNVFGTDIMPDNIKELKVRFMVLLIKNSIEMTDEIAKILLRNFQCVPLDKYSKGSLDYDFMFNKKIDSRDIERTIRHYLQVEKHINKTQTPVSVEKINTLSLEDITKEYIKDFDEI